MGQIVCKEPDAGHHYDEDGDCCQCALNEMADHGFAAHRVIRALKGHLIRYMGKPAVDRIEAQAYLERTS